MLNYSDYINQQTRNISALSKTLENLPLSSTRESPQIKELNQILEKLKTKFKEEKDEKLKIENNNKFPIEKSKILELRFDSNKPNFANYKIIPAICRTYFIKKERDEEIDWEAPLLQESSIHTRIVIHDKPFAAGALRYAFHMRDLDYKEDMVAKIPKIINEKYTPRKMRKEIESLFICAHILSEFNDRLLSLFSDKTSLLSFVHCYIYELLSDSVPFQYYWVENYIESSYEKFNNNDGWVALHNHPISHVAQALSHFSWQFTKGYLMIVDLQGGSAVLTDPQIHCINLKRFGAGNQGFLGMNKFFMTHFCNEYCKKLNLIDPRVEQHSLFKKEFYYNYEGMPQTDETIIKLCDLCKKPSEINNKDYFEWRLKFDEVYCFSCQKKKGSTYQKKKCKDCREFFWFSPYWFHMKRSENPIRCVICRKDNRDKLRSLQQAKKTFKNYFDLSVKNLYEENKTPEIDQNYVYISKIDAKGVGFKMGLRKEDILLNLQKKEITKAEDVYRLMGIWKEGRKGKLNLTVRRGMQIIKFAITED